MITVFYYRDSETKLWVVYGTRIINNNPVTRLFETFKTEKGAKNYCERYAQKQEEFYSKKRR